MFMKRTHKIRRTIALLVMGAGFALLLLLHPDLYEPVKKSNEASPEGGSAIQTLNELAVKGRAPKTGYERSQFGDGWAVVDGCDMRNIVLARDLKNIETNDKCQVVSGTLSDPYTGKTIIFQRGPSTSDDVQIDHVVALSDAWQKGAQQLRPEEREALANDPLELLAVDGGANQAKSDGDAASWLPPNKAFRCQYIARQVAVKKKYGLWVTVAEKEAMARVLSTCPNQTLPVE
jgi:hypothetical protein